MADWDDVDPDEVMRRFDAAMEQLKSRADLETALHIRGLLEEAEPFVWPPAPNTAHPSLERQARFVRDLMAADRYNVVLPVPNPAYRFITDPEPDVSTFQENRVILTIRKAWSGLTAWTEAPYVWVWKCAVDESGRWVSGDSWSQPAPLDPWRQP